MGREAASNRPMFFHYNERTMGEGQRTTKNGWHGLVVAAQRSYERQPPKRVYHQRSESRRYLNGFEKDQYGREIDSRKQKFYDAEQWVTEGEDLKELEDIAAYIEDIIRRAWWQRRYGILKFVIADGRGSRRSGCRFTRDGMRVRFPRHRRFEREVLHEITHAVVPKPHAWHGRLFAARFLELIRWRMGKGWAETLKKGYRREGVKWHPHRS